MAPKTQTMNAAARAARNQEVSYQAGRAEIGIEIEASGPAPSLLAARKRS